MHAELVEPNIYSYSTRREGEVKFRVRYHWRGRDVWKSGLPNITLARDYLKKVKGQMVERRYFPERVKGPLLRDYAAVWLMAKRRALKHTTLASYESHLRLRLLPTLGARPLETITPLMVREAAVVAVGSRSTIAGMLRTLSSLFSDAIQDGLVLHSPALRPGKFLGKAEKEEVEILTLAEERVLLDAAMRWRPHWYPLLLFLMRTGVRIGEAIALERADLDLRDRFARIRQNYTRGRLTSTKGRRVRRVDLSPQIADLLMQGTVVSPTLVFVTLTGHRVQYRNFLQRVFFPLCRKAGLRRFTPHVLRHTYASRLIAANVPLAYISRQLGHSSIRVTVDTYGHLLPDASKGAVKVLDASGHLILRGQETVESDKTEGPEA
jgi:integrase